MAEHIMKLHPGPFAKIKDGSKTIELRLYDEKRRRISVGDTIQFVNTEDPADMVCLRVRDLFVFDSFDELYKHLPLMECGYSAEDIHTASPIDMEVYYSKEEQKQYGVIGIQIAPL
ncbi:MAG: RNA-binding protein [Clostridia bacterium]|nr:RNA-binding protein [Clostridia bacterium]